LIEDLDRRGIRTKANGLTDGRVRGGVRFRVGSLAYLLKNWFYIGEVVYRGEVHRGEHEPILDRDLFEAVQAKLSSNAVARQVRLKGSPAILTGRIFDDRGNRNEPDALEQMRRALPLLRVARDPAETKGRSRQRRARARPRILPVNFAPESQFDVLP
jgi:hypothetical protein